MDNSVSAETVYEVVPVSRNVAAKFVDDHHQYKFSTRSYKFALGIKHNEALVGVAICGPTGARNTEQDLRIIEIRRLCVVEGHSNGYHALAQSCMKAAKALGYSSIVAYTENHDTDDAYIASGFETTETIQRRLRGGLLSALPAEGHQLRLMGPPDKRSDDHSGVKVDATRWECDLVAYRLELTEA